jgi:hypothetical protein
LNRLQDEKLKSLVSESACVELKEPDRIKAFEDCLEALRRKRIARRLEELRRQIARAEKEGDSARVSGFMAEYQTLLQERG